MKTWTEQEVRAVVEELEAHHGSRWMDATPYMLQARYAQQRARSTHDSVVSAAMKAGGKVLDDNPYDLLLELPAGMTITEFRKLSGGEP